MARMSLTGGAGSRWGDLAPQRAVVVSLFGCLVNAFPDERNFRLRDKAKTL